LQVETFTREVLSSALHGLKYILNERSINVAQELEGEMNTRRVYPPHSVGYRRLEAANGIGQGLLSFWGNFQGDENPYGVAWFYQ
jgi:hypothetical protein